MAARLIDIAKRADVSVSTASVVLNPPPNPPPVSEERANRVRQAARELNYAPNYHARTMRTGRSMSIAFALDTGATGNRPETRLGAHYFSAVLGGIDAKASAMGYSVAVFGASADDRRALDVALEAAQQRRIDGVITSGTLALDVVERVVKEKEAHPLVLVDPVADLNYRYPVVGADEPGAVELAMTHLAELGHRGVLWIEPRRPGDGPGRIGERGLAVKRSAKRRGISFESVIALEQSAEPSSSARRSEPQARAEARMIGARVAMRERLRGADTRSMTAVLCYNDQLASGVVNALNEANLRVPADVSVVGFDNAEAAFTAPPVTSVDLRRSDIGERAAELLIDRLNRGAATRRGNKRLVVEPALRLRESTAPPRQTA